MGPLLSVRDLQTQFDTDEGTVRAVDGVSFDVAAGETVCLVGESGSGKTVACESITKLIPMPPGEIVGGEIHFDGEDLAGKSPRQLQAYRGGHIGHVFQNPLGALDPVYTVGEQVVEAIRIHRDVSKGEARERAMDLLDRVGIGDVADRFDDYPHQFSGGMKQRVVVAMALACDPDLLIADEPTTALDVTIQAQVLRLLSELQDERGMGLLFVTHDLGVVAEIADRVVVMYAGKVMERGDVHDVFAEPSHPYTRALLRCLPGRGQAFETIGGTLPDPTDPPDGCRFHPRCPHAVDECAVGDQPMMEPVADGRPAVEDGRRAAGDGRSATERDGPAAEDGRPATERDGPAAEDRRPTAEVAGDHEVSCLLYDDEHYLPPGLLEEYSPASKEGTND